MQRTCSEKEEKIEMNECERCHKMCKRYYYPGYGWVCATCYTLIDGDDDCREED